MLPWQFTYNLEYRPCDLLYGICFAMDHKKWTNFWLRHQTVTNVLGISVLDNETVAWSSLDAYLLFNCKIGFMLRKTPYLKATRQTALAPADAHAQKVPLPPGSAAHPLSISTLWGQYRVRTKNQPWTILWSLTNVCWPSVWSKTGYREQFFRSHKSIWTFKFRFILHCSTGFAFVDTATGRLT